MTIAISQYHGMQEQGYRKFPLTREGLREAREYLDEPLVNGHRRAVSPWQFNDPWGDRGVEEAYRMIANQDGVSLAKLLQY